MFWQRKRSTKDFAEEIRSHLALEEDELRAEGLSEKEAHRVARVEFGSLPAVQEQFYQRSRWNWLDRVGRDLRFAMRSLLQSPGFMVTVILTLALGIGANTAIFSAMHSVLYSMLPVHDAKQVAYAHITGIPNGASSIGDARTSFSYPVYEALRQQKKVLSDVMAYVPLAVGKVGVRTGTEPQEARAEMVSGSFFSGLGVPMVRGRGFSTQDETDHTATAVLSYQFWTRSFDRDPNVIGKTMYVKSVPVTIIGVAAEGFAGVEEAKSTDFWVPLQNRAELAPWGLAGKPGEPYTIEQNWWFMRMLVRLAPGVTREQAAAAMQPVFGQAAYTGLGTPSHDEKPPALGFLEAKSFPWIEGDLKTGLMMMMWMVGLVLLIALTNIVMLLMARNAVRQREFSLRLALGAHSADILRQLITEGLLLATFGGVIGWIVAIGATRTLGQWSEIETSLAPDHTVLLVTLGVLLLAAILFGLAPLRVGVAGGAGMALKSSATTAHAEPGKARTGKAIVAMQMALCVVLLVSTGLLVRTMLKLKNISLGMHTEGLVVFGVNSQRPDAVQFYEELVHRLRVLPGVEAVSLMSNRIGSGWSNNNDAVIDGRDPRETAGISPMARNNYIGSEFFHTIGVPLIVGREFDDTDTATSQKVAIVNELFVKRFLPNTNPLGHHVSGNYKGESMVIVGVVKDHKYTGIKEEPVPMVFYDYTQRPEMRGMHVEMRVQGDALTVLPAARKVLANMDPDLPLTEPTLQQKAFESSIGGEVLFARLAECFGLLAILLVATGLYGTLAYRVNRRTAEIGVRMAVGAQRRQVVWMVLKDSLILMAIGVAIGIPLSIFAGRQLASTLYGVKPLDGLSYAIAIGGVALVALLASAIPAGKAASVNPLEALRSE